MGLGSRVSRETMGAMVLLSDPSKDSCPTLLLANLNDEILLVGARVELLQTSVLELSLWRTEYEYGTGNSDSSTYMLS